MSFSLRSVTIIGLYLADMYIILVHFYVYKTGIINVYKTGIINVYKTGILSVYKTVIFYVYKLYNYILKNIIQMNIKLIFLIKINYGNVNQLLMILIQ